MALRRDAYSISHNFLKLVLRNEYFEQNGQSKRCFLLENGSGHVIAVLAVFGVVVARVLQMDTIPFVGRLECLGPLVCVLVVLVEQVIATTANQ